MEKYFPIFFSPSLTDDEMGLLLQHHTITKCKIVLFKLFKLIEVIAEMKNWSWVMKYVV